MTAKILERKLPACLRLQAGSLRYGLPVDFPGSAW
jgi:hypothetical protein